MNYLGKFLPAPEICETLQKLTSAKVCWTWKSMYQELYEKVETIIKDDVCMKLYNKKTPYI